VLAKHSKSFSLIDCVSVGVDRMQRNFEPMRKQVEAWQQCELTDVMAKVVIDEAFVESKLEPPKHLARTVHDIYFEPLRIARRKGSNAVCIVTRSCLQHAGPVDHFEGFLVDIKVAVASHAINLSVALKRPERSFGGTTDSKVSSFTAGPAPSVPTLWP